MGKKSFILKGIKIALGSSLAIFLASLLHLQYASSAGIITLLSIQNTKKETLKVAGKRILAFFGALVIAALSFGFFGFQTFAFGVFLLLFVIFCSSFGLQDGISMNAVLVTHFLADFSMSLPKLVNESLILFIGLGFGILFNLYMPDKKKEIKEAQMSIEEDFRAILGKMAKVLLMESKESYHADCFIKLDNDLKQNLDRAYENQNNTLLSDTRYYIQYTDMRQSQSAVLKKIYENICLLDRVPKQTYVISKFMDSISMSFHEYNNVKDLKTELSEIKDDMKQEPMPASREEFENRAILYQILLLLEQFLTIKEEFAASLDEKQIARYWEEK